MFVSVGSDSSDVISIDVGVPQGSIAELLLFLLYNNDISHACYVMKCVHYSRVYFAYVVKDNALH